MWLAKPEFIAGGMAANPISRVASVGGEKLKSPLRGASPKRLVENRRMREISSRGRLVFLLFCLLLRCHEGASVSDFPLQGVNDLSP